MIFIVAGCGGTAAQPDLGGGDLAELPDLAAAPDLSTSPDLSMATPDLSMPDLATPDLATPDLSMHDLSVLRDFSVLHDFSSPDLTDACPPPDLTPWPDLGGVLQGSGASSPAAVDLTAEGTLDWLHWGLVFETSVDRKSGASELGELTQIGSADLHQYINSAVTYSWSDGAPTASVAGTTNGIYALGEDNGFALSAPALVTPRTLRVYVSSFGADFSITAQLSDGSAAPFFERVIHSGKPSSVYRMYTFVYSSPNPDTTLDVSWVDDHDHFGGANVTAEAATLQ
jgi:hypothetical protein